MLLRRLRYYQCQLRHMKIFLLPILTLALLSVTVKQKYNPEQSNSLELIENYYEHLVNCSKIIDGDQDEIDKVKILTISKEFKQRLRVKDSNYTEWTKDCQTYTKVRKYITKPLSKQEEEFPIAYSIVVHYRADMFERLLRAIYQPQNYYCIHVDKKSSESFSAAIKGIVSCFDNVFIASKLEDVVYASWSRVQADLNCMADLLKMNASWKYLINLCGMDFPIKTNLEIVEILKSLKGRNNLETEKMQPHKEKRWKFHHEVVNGRIKDMGIAKQPPPVKTHIFSGNAYFIVSRGFVEYIFKDKKILSFFEWAKDTFSPDEFVWATLQRIPGVPGSVPPHSKYDVSDMNSLARFVQWVYFEGDVSNGAPYPPCNGPHVRSVCIFGVGNLKWLLQTAHLFVNKLDTDIDPFVVQCLERHLRNKILKQIF
ncbi:beta-1,3-galactosyl-O-glycosyl-glycoprotein beta-1,6-N-acetylglucosaminyltransferase-like [Protopterus annectens]|uniref:beta-1,3-galactosyl-O-glycosyl-glycoprotein beta-1,6-N-acetylglucosaminyltransferase-like n=1 Tax=Protopterus annectens TaxID=7888 RepID=UPI001CFA3B08|nr:beta-1,3-galactosyl-O-glycosyl-glycoprotein beta-1,6-N-acetylglucosaminyltransferase-like [Protopterus annectens]XP_043916792.1 beta-1,3-galactosyl-O-glycosyl-glycoprotein beta-1,6-N-acetylglucosaminyltransferase-like [Protopterus annectens]XP_043916793.1 beta-1,3-galactosyl-O-glycosyl-glycoprotein beta-1,6-N-acetylglucosaminyltransferase-like [Protopterus annectens]XP_043916794.1 beta-1,3-galactosyl-O-glycosyl-glycoprotein beta-1,6-N-acetylglucosaminyltransferase-like [Protopterus annectens]